MPMTITHNSFETEFLITGLKNPKQTTHQLKYVEFSTYSTRPSQDVVSALRSVVRTVRRGTRRLVDGSSASTLIVNDKHKESHRPVVVTPVPPVTMWHMTSDRRCSLATPARQTAALCFNDTDDFSQFFSHKVDRIRNSIVANCSMLPRPRQHVRITCRHASSRHSSTYYRRLFSV